MSRLYDVSPPVDAALAVWPGDTRYEFSLAWRMEEGASVNVGQIRATVHLGAHADAPFHFDLAGAGVDQAPLEAYLGPAWVVDVAGLDPIRPDALAGLDFGETPRLLLRTAGWPDPRVFPERIAVVEESLPDWLGERGVRLLGVDVPSVDPIDSETLPRHRALARNGVAILESLQLAEVPPGRYELIALPLRLTGADASPVRAVLRTLPAR